MKDGAAKACTAFKANCLQVHGRIWLELSAVFNLVPECLCSYKCKVSSFPPFYGHRFLGCITPNKRAPKGLVLLLCCVLLTPCFIQLTCAVEAGNNLPSPFNYTGARAPLSPPRAWPRPHALLHPHADEKEKNKEMKRTGRCLVKVLKLEPLLSQWSLKAKSFTKKSTFPAMAMASVPQSLLGSRMLLLFGEEPEETIWRAGALGLCHESPAIPEPSSPSLGTKASH